MGKTAIKNIIFDLGGVILNLDYQRTIAAFSRLAGRDVSLLYSQQQQSELFDRWEVGQIDAETFRDGLREMLQVSASDQELDNCWNVMLLDIPSYRLEWLQKLSQQKRIFLLSNTNAIHKACFDANLMQAHGFAELDHFFEKAYYSHILGQRKPHAETFRSVVEANGLDVAETLFIDDSVQHIEGAKKIGLQTYLLSPPEELTELQLWRKVGL